MKLFQVDAFTDKPFGGNPAAVCVLKQPQDEAWMQDLAREMNLSETAYLLKDEERSGFGLRWFTPTTEVDLCGHATLASAHVLWEYGYLPREDEVRFHTRSGRLTVRLADDGWMEMDFQAKRAEPTAPPVAVVDALGVQPVRVLRNEMDLLVVLRSEKEVRDLAPDLPALGREDVRGIIVTACSTSGEYAFVSRFFAPRVGVPEDPVTGSAHCALGPYWAEALGENTMIGYQASPRGGVVRVEVREERVLLSGRAVTVLEGTLTHATCRR